MEDINEVKADGKSLCGCNYIREWFGITSVKITKPSEGANKSAGESIPFVAMKNPKIDSYSWDFGDGSAGTGQSIAHSYSGPGAYTAKLTAYYQGCSGTNSVAFNVIGCIMDNDCSANQECRLGICQNKQAITPNETINSTGPSQVLISIISPTNNQVFTDKDILLIYNTTPAGISCSYSLNDDLSFTTLQSNQAELTAKEGENSLKMMCRDNVAALKFTVTPKDNDIFDDFRGGNGKGSILSMFRDTSVEQKLSAEDARRLVVDIVQNYNFSVTKLAERQGDSSLVMLNVKNIMPITINFLDLIVKMPKNIAQSADLIKSEQNFTIIEQDPIIKFSFNRMMSGDISTASFIVDTAVDEELLKTITVETRIDQETLLKKQRETADALKINREFEEYEKDGEIYTRIKLRFNPKKELLDLSVYEKIPKCLAEHIDEIQMDEDARQIIKIINPDPVVMWQFDKMASEKEFSYEVKGILSEECKQQIAAMGIADELGIDLGRENIF